MGRGCVKHFTQAGRVLRRREGMFTTTLTRTLRTATIGGVALTLALGGTALGQDTPPPPTDGPPIVDGKPPGDGTMPPLPEDPAPVDPKPEPTPEPTPAPVTPDPVSPDPSTPGPVPPPVDEGTAPPVAKPPVAKPKAKQSCKKKKSKKARRACKRRAAKAKRTGSGVVARAAMQGVTIGTANCTGQQGQKTLRASAPTVAAGQPFQWIEHWNTVAKWNGSQWAVDGTSWVGPFWTRTDYPGHVYYKGAWYLRSNGGGASNHYVGSAFAVGVQWVKGHSSNVVEYRYMSTTDSMSVTGAPVHWCNG